MMVPLPRQLFDSRSELEAFSRHLALGVYCSDHRLLCRLWGEIPFFVDTRDCIFAPRLVLDGFWEIWVTQALARYLRPGMWCVDVGANYGYYTLLMALACEPPGYVLACEPNENLAPYLKTNLTVNGCGSWVEIVRSAIGDRICDEVEFAVSSDYHGHSGIKGYGSGSSLTRVPMTTLDWLCQGWPRLDLVKIDVESAEVLVWRGMRETLHRFPEVAVIVELHVEQNQKRAEEFLDEVSGTGYVLRYIGYDGNVHRAEKSKILGNPREHWALWLQKS